MNFPFVPVTPRMGHETVSKNNSVMLLRGTPLSRARATGWFSGCRNHAWPA